MTTSISRYPGFLVAAFLIGAMSLSPVEARDGKGGAAGLDVQAAEDGDLVGLTIDLTAAEVDEGPTTAAFDSSATVVSLSAVSGAITADTVTAGTRHEPFGHFVESDAGTENLVIALDLLGLSLVDLDSGTIESDARVDGTCGDFGAVAGAGVENLSLSILGESVTTNLTATPGLDMVLLDTTIEVALDDSTLSADSFVILNEQSVAGDQSSIDVNALRITLDITVTDDVLGTTLLSQTAEILVARSEAAFLNCSDVDLAVDKTTDLDGNAVVGEPFEYTATVTELTGNADATAVEFTDTLPPEVTFDAFTEITGGGQCDHDSGTITCQWLTIPAGSSVSVTYRVIPNTVTDPASVSNLAVVATADNDTDDGNDSDSVDVVIEGVPLGDADLQLTKTASPVPATVGGSLIYTLTITNNGPADAENVVVSDTLDASLTINSAGATGGGSCSVVGQQVSCTWPLLANGASETVSINTSPTEAGTVSNAAVASADNPDPDPDGADDSIDVDVGDPDLEDADLQLTKTASPDPATVGGSLIYTLTITNNGPADAENVVVSDTLDASLTINSADATGGGSCSVVGQQVDCTWPALANGGSETVGINTTPTEAGTVSNAAVAVADNPDPDGADDSIDVDVEDPDLEDADLQLTKTASPDPATVGEPLVYTLTLTNNGPADAENVVVSDTLDASLVIDAASASDGGNCDVIGQTVTCRWDLLTNGQSVTATIETTPTEAGTVSNAASVVADNPDPDPDSNDDDTDVDVDDPDVGPPSEPEEPDPRAIPTTSAAGLAVLFLLIFMFGLGLLSRRERRG